MYFSTCIYTIVKASILDLAASSPENFVNTENKRWVTGAEVFREAADAGARVAVLFADAADCSKLIYWGILEKLTVEDGSTTYTVSGLCPLAGYHTPQELVLKSTGKNIAPEFIRPYAICYTPEFLSNSGGVRS